MQLDKKLIHRIFLCLTGLLFLVWLLTDTQRVQAVWSTVSALVSPFVAGAAVAFVFKVPMRGVEKQHSSTTTVHYAGAFADELRLREEFYQALKAM